MTTALLRSPAVRLLNKVSLSGHISAEALAGRLHVTPAALAKYGSGQTRMPAEARLELAQIVSELLPSEARAKRRIEAEARAELAFRNTTTVTHATAPPSRFGERSGR